MNREAVVIFSDTQGSVYYLTITSLFDWEDYIDFPIYWEENINLPDGWEDNITFHDYLES